MMSLLRRAIATGLAMGALTVSLINKAEAASYSESYRQRTIAITPPSPTREMRGAWITTVFNVDWPSRKGLPVAQQQSELIALLDRAAQLHMNAVVFQVRTECDAFYNSPYEPWSEFLSGKMGEAPRPYYDPLAFAVTEAHKRGLELHAWINPFRAAVSDKVVPAANHVSVRNVRMVRHHGNFLWLDPGDKNAQDHTLKVAADIVRRYDIDGLQIDDYFYPPTQPGPKGKPLDFDDSLTWQLYVNHGGKMSHGDWRRENINNFVRNLYEQTKREKPWVKFGISPPGIWRPHFPPQIQGRDVYEAIYADTKKWLNNGWCDYFTPQLYWPIAKKEQSFPVLLQWWEQQNLYHRLLWPGLATGEVGSAWKPSEILEQIQIGRREFGVSGHLHYHMKSVTKNPRGLADQLERLYAEPALVPAMPWLSNVSPDKPVLSVRHERGELRLSWRGNSRNNPARWWVVQQLNGSQWSTEVLFGDVSGQTIRYNHHAPTAVAVTAVNRYGLQSAPAIYLTGVLSERNP